MGWLLDCNTGSLRKHKTSVPVPYCFQTIMSLQKGTFLGTAKNNLQVPVRLSFQGLPLFLGKKRRQNALALQQDVVLSFLLPLCYMEFNYITAAY